MTNKIECDHDCSCCEILCSDAIKKHNENLSNMQYENIKLKKENAELLERLNDIESVCEGTSEDAVCMKVEKLKIENKLLVEKLEEWKIMFKHGLNHLNNKIVWDISPTSQIHTFLKKELEA